MPKATVNDSPDQYSLDEIKGNSQAVNQVKSLIRQVASSDITVLITGESGSGKELIAEGIHKLSERSPKSLITVNCGAIPEGIFESEIFGHEKGSFTSADQRRKGYFEMADHGTLFLDEIGEMPLSVQVKILRALEVRRFLRVGGSAEISVDVRIIAATNQDLANSVARGTFRNDLYYRLNAVTIRSPALRERPEDIQLLTEFFADKFCERNNRPSPQVEPEAIRLLQQHYWSGNVRELKNFVESIITLSSGSEITAQGVRERLAAETYSPNLPVLLSKTAPVDGQDLTLRTLLELRSDIAGIKTLLQSLLQRNLPQREAGFRGTEEVIAYPIDPTERGNHGEIKEHSKDSLDTGYRVQRLSEIERDQIVRTLMDYNGNRRRAARALGIGERTLYRKIKEFDLK